MKKTGFLLLIFLHAFLENHAQKSSVNVTDFGLKPDFRRFRVSLRGNIVSSGEYRFIPADIGKVIAVSRARIYAAYTPFPLTLNAMIQDVKNGTAIIQSTHQKQMADVQNAEAMMGTNNFDAIQKALDHCAAKGIGQLLLNYTGTAYVVPFFSDLCKSHGRNDGGNTSGLIVKGNIAVKGMGKGKTVIRAGSEDLVYLDTQEQFRFDLFYLDAVPNGTVESKIFRDFTITGADRASTAIRNWNVVFRTSYADFHSMQVLFENLDLNTKSGFDEAFTTSRGGRWNSSGTVKDFCQYTIRNCNWSNYMPLSIFAQVPAQNQNAVNGSKKLLVENSIFDGGGIPIMKQYKNAASIAGELLTIQSPGFSFNDYNSYIEANEKRPVLVIEEAVEATIAELIRDYPGTKDIRLNKVIPLKADFFDVYTYDAKNGEIRSVQAGHTDGGSDLVHLVTTVTGDNFKSGNKIKLVLRKMRCKVRAIISPASATIDWQEGSTVSIRNATVIMNDDYRMAEGHTMYIHPNVSCLFKNLTIKNCLKLALHHYSGNGVTGNRLYFEMNAVHVLPTNDYALEHGNGWIAPLEFSMDNNSAKLPCMISSSSFKLYQTEAVLQVKKSVIYGGQCSGGRFENCTGGIDIWGGAPTTFINCNFEWYSALRAANDLKLDVTSVNSNFVYLNVLNVNSLNISGGQIGTLRLDPEMKKKEKLFLKMIQVKVNSRE